MIITGLLALLFLAEKSQLCQKITFAFVSASHDFLLSSWISYKETTTMPSAAERSKLPQTAGSM